MFRAWESCVQPSDLVVHLGDLILAGRDHPEVYDRVKRLPGQKYLIKGNHDRHGAAWYAALGFTRVPPQVVRLHGYPPILFSHRPQLAEVGIMRGIGINIHCHIHHKMLDWPPSRVRWINASVEQTDYQPMRLGSLLQCSESS